MKIVNGTFFSDQVKYTVMTCWVQRAFQDLISTMELAQCNNDENGH